METTRHSVLTIFTDGVARGNPGEGGFGVIIKDTNGTIIEEVGGYIGVTTNNIAEYTALLTALKTALKYSDGKIIVYSDSELMVRQLNGIYKVKNEGLLPLYQEAKKLTSNFSDFIIEHIPREKNKEADSLANKAVNTKATVPFSRTK